ncbi:MAG: hypothetical protein ACR2FU_13390 [Streptosporangiaceae bacterium]
MSRGDGIENAARVQITGSGDCVLKYAHDCSSLGSEGNFIIDEDGGNDFNGASVNELGPGGHPHRQTQGRRRRTRQDPARTAV